MAFPYPIRKPLTAIFILAVLAVLAGKKVTGRDRRDDPTPPDQLGSLSFW